MAQIEMDEQQIFKELFENAEIKITYNQNDYNEQMKHLDELYKKIVQKEFIREFVNKSPEEVVVNDFDWEQFIDWEQTSKA